MVYCDESRQNTSEYKLIGGIWAKRGFDKQFEDEFNAKCQNQYGLLPNHMKWSRVPTLKSLYFNFYTDMFDLYFEYNKANKVYFKTIVAHPDYDMKHPHFHGGDFEEGFYKLYYKLIIHTLKYQNSYHIRVGARSPSKKVNPLSETDRLLVLKNSLNRGLRKKLQFPVSSDPVLSVEARKPKEHRLMQLADIFMGAVGYHKNSLHIKPGAKEGKVCLANYICETIGKKDLCFNTKWDDREFNIFEFSP